MNDLPLNISSSTATVAVKPGKNPEMKQHDTQEFGNVLARQLTDSANASTRDNQGNSQSSPAEVPNKTSTEKENPRAKLSADDAVESTALNLSPAMIESLLAQPAQTSVLPASSRPTDDTVQKGLPKKDALSATPVAGKLGVPAALALTAAAETPETLIAPGVSALPGVIVKPEVVAATGTLLTSVPGKTDKLAADPANPLKLVKKGDLSDQLLQGQDKLIPLAEKSSKGQKGFSELIKEPAMLDIKPPFNVPLQHNNPVSELTGATQQAAFAPALPLTASPSSPATINTPVNHANWGDEFSQKITWIANQQNQSAELHLNPPHLGPLDVVLKMQGDQATATFTSPHAAVREAIEQAMPKLREMLADNGIMLGNAMVNDQSAQKNHDNTARKSQARSNASDGDLDVAAIQESRTTTIPRHQGMVDTFA